MGQVRWARWTVGLAMALALCGVRPAAADIRSDQAAAILEWPSVVFVQEDFIFQSGFVLQTLIQLSNVSNQSVRAWCFYENANSHCTNTGEVCFFPQECCNSEFGCGSCQPGWNETDFYVNLTPSQPLGWLASQGMAGFDVSSQPPKKFGKFPIDGVTNFGPDGSSNAGSRIPPVPEEPFTGSLRCIAVDESGFPVDRNVLKGEATISLFGEIGEDGVEGPDDDDFDVLSVAKHNAIGVQAIEGAVNDDKVLCLGGRDTSEQCPDGAEYNGCPNFMILNHFFDFAENPVTDDGSFVVTLLTLVPCTQDYLRQIPGETVVQYVVYNEFEQRVSFSRKVVCKSLLALSSIDTTQNERSIWSAGVAGTLTGQTRLNPLTTGLFAVATEVYFPSGDFFIPPLADFNVHYQGDRAQADIITLP
jgi:hypothetical protein